MAPASALAPAPEPEPEPDPAPAAGDAGWVWPILGGLHSSEFGWRADMGDFHNGLDIAVPAGTPADIVARLHREVSTAVKEPTITKYLTERGGAIVNQPPAQAKAFVQAEAQKWARVVKETGIAAQ